MMGIELLPMASSLLLSVNGGIQCTVPRAPQIMVNPVSEAIRYDFSKTEEELTKAGSNTVSPYAPGTDTATGGLREDKPELKIDVSWQSQTYPAQQLSCLWYDKIIITIKLSPKIYVAKKYRPGVCKEAILEHERKHVSVDRQIVNKYAAKIGTAVQNAVNEIGAMGPYNQHELKDVQKRIVGHVEAAVDSQQFLMFQEMRKMQGQIDSLEEYQRVNKICEEAAK